MSLRSVGIVASARLRELGDYVRSQQITEHLFVDAHASGLRIADIVHMDEYTIDIVIPLPDGLVLVYDTT